MSAGEFRVSLVNTVTGAWYINKTVTVDPAEREYETPVYLNVPEGAYKAAVCWRPTPSAAGS